MNYFSILIFVILVAPVALKEYQRDKGMNNWVKIINLFICFLLFGSFTNTVRNEVSILFSSTHEFKVMMQSNVGLLTPVLNGISWIIYLLLSFVLSINAVLLALRKEKSRVLFLRLIPILWIFESIHMYKYILNKLEIVRFGQLMYILFAIGIICLILFILYTSKPFKSFFQYKQPEPDSF